MKKIWVDQHKRTLPSGKKIRVRGHFRNIEVYGKPPSPSELQFPLNIGEHIEYYPEGARKRDVPTMWFVVGTYDGRQTRGVVDRHLRVGHAVLITKKGAYKYEVCASEAPVV